MYLFFFSIAVINITAKILYGRKGLLGNIFPEDKDFIMAWKQ